MPPLGGFVVTFPDIDDGVTQAETEEEAMEMAADLLGCMIGERMMRGLDLPLARKHRGGKYRPVRLPALQEAKAELYNAFRAAGVRKAELWLGKELAIQIRDAA